VNHVEILFLMGVAAFKAAQDLRLQPDRKYLDGLIDSLTTLVREETGNNRFAINLDEVLNAVIAIGLGAIGAGATTLGAAILHLPVSCLPPTSFPTSACSIGRAGNDGMNRDMRSCGK